MPAITDSVQFVKGIGPKKVKLFEKLHISTLQDALETYPRDYEDRTHITRIADIADEDRYAVRAILGTEPKVSRARRSSDRRSALWPAAFRSAAFPPLRAHCFPPAISPRQRSSQYSSRPRTRPCP